MRRVLSGAGVLVLTMVGLSLVYWALLANPQLLFCFYTERGRLALYSDRPFDPAKAQTLLADIEARLRRSSLNDGAAPHRIFIVNADWRQHLLFNKAYGAGGVNFYPLTRNVFIRNADVDSDTVYGASGQPTERPRTLAYFAAHEIGHTLTAEYRGAANLWNFRLPAWVREGTADYIAFGGDVDIDRLLGREHAHDPNLDPGSGHYDRYRMLVAYLVRRKGWTVEKILASGLPQTAPQGELEITQISTTREFFDRPGRAAGP